MLQVIHVARFQRSVLHSGMDTNISHSNNSIIPILILCHLKIDSTTITLQLQMLLLLFTNGSNFNLNSKPAYPALALAAS
jgi:hypothetical protein